MAIFERHENNFVAVEFVPVPTAMLADKRPASIGRGQGGSRIKGKAERRDMRTQRVIRGNGFRDQIRVLWMGARVEMLPIVAIGPSVKAAVLDRGQVVRH